LNIVSLDADVIIDLHRLNLWESLTKNNKILVSSIVVCREVYHYDDAAGKRHVIDLSKEAGKSFFKISATIEQLSTITKEFEGLFEIDLHAGEKEALAILTTKKDMLFCTCDKAAMRALGFLGISHKGISFEKLLSRSGIKKKLEIKHSERQFSQFTQEGVSLRLSMSTTKK
jgi:hypothetical protein